MSRTTLFPDPATAVLNAIEFWQDEWGMPPTIEELRKLLNVGSRRTIQRYLKKAEGQGLIKRWSGARGIAVINTAEPASSSDDCERAYKQGFSDGYEKAMSETSE